MLHHAEVSLLSELEGRLVDIIYEHDPAIREQHMRKGFEDLYKAVEQFKAEIEKRRLLLEAADESSMEDMHRHYDGKER